VIGIDFIGNKVHVMDSSRQVKDMLQQVSEFKLGNHRKIIAYIGGNKIIPKSTIGSSPRIAVSHGKNFLVGVSPNLKMDHPLGTYFFLCDPGDDLNRCLVMDRYQPRGCQAQPK